MMSTTETTSPVIMLATAPAVVYFFQVIESNNAGKLALAATAKANPTMKATLTSLKSRPNSTASTPSTMVAIRATLTSSFSDDSPLRTTPTYISWDKAVAPARVSPATTARIVANATEVIKP